MQIQVRAESIVQHEQDAFVSKLVEILPLISVIGIILFAIAA